MVGRSVTWSRCVGKVVGVSLSEQATWSDDLYVVDDDAVCVYVVLDGLLMALTAR